MVYLGDNWPDAYRNGIFMCNLHGNRVNHDILERHGSGYVAHHGKDFLLANDPWFRGLALQYGPDGGVFVTDWRDTGECHNYDQRGPQQRPHLQGHLRPAGAVAGRPGQAQRRGTGQAATAQERLVRAPRPAAAAGAGRGGEAGQRTRKQLEAIFEDQRQDVRRRLRAMWALYVTGGLKREAPVELGGRQRPPRTSAGVGDSPAMPTKANCPASGPRTWRNCPGIDASTPACVKLALASAGPADEAGRRAPTSSTC